MLSIHLGQDENDCFSAWVSAKEAGLTDNKGQDQKGIFLFYFFHFERCSVSLYKNYIIEIIYSKLWKSTFASTP